MKPNWEFLIKHKGSTHMWDEAHELVYSRNFNSQENKAASSIVAQIRKLCQDSGDFSTIKLLKRFNNHIFSYFIYDVLSRHNNLYVTSQTTSKIEKDIRDLSQIHIHCHSEHMSGTMIVYNDFYFVDAVSNALEKFESGLVRPKTAFFIGNDYFHMYDRFSIIDMDGEYI